MMRGWQPFCDRFPVLDSRRRIVKTRDWFARRAAVTQVLVPIDTDGMHDSCSNGAAPWACSAGLEPIPRMRVMG